MIKFCFAVRRNFSIKIQSNLTAMLLLRCTIRKIFSGNLTGKFRLLFKSFMEIDEGEEVIVFRKRF